MSGSKRPGKVGLSEDGDIPGQELLDAVDGVVGDLSEDSTEIERRIESVEFGRADQAVEGCGALGRRSRRP